MNVFEVLVLGENKELHPGALDKLVLTCNPDRVAEFMQGINVVKQRIIQVNPGLIIIPERGAAPITWLLQQDFSETPFLHLPLGTHFDLITGNFSGINKAQKEDIIKYNLNYFSQHLDRILISQHLDRILIIDEAQSGGTITFLALAIRRIIDRNTCDTIHVIALQNSTSSNPENKKKKYKWLTSNTIPGIETATIPIPLFFMDKEHMLNTLFYPSDAGDNAHLMQHTLQNTDARNLFLQLKQIFDFPDQNINLYQIIQSYHTTKTNQDHITAWFNNYIQMCIHIRSLNK